MGKQKKDRTPKARLELDKSMQERINERDNATPKVNAFSYHSPSVFSGGLISKTKLYYSRDEKIAIDVNAICENFGDTDLRFRWQYVELNSDGIPERSYTNTTKSPYAVVSSLNNVANDHNIEISAKVEDAGNPTETVDAGRIVIKPVIAPKEITDNVEWFSFEDGKKVKANSELDKMVYSVIELYGYNGEDVTVNRFVTLNGAVIFDNTEKLVVCNNCLLVKFNRSEIISEAKEGETVSLKYTILTSTGYSTPIEREFKLVKHTLVEGEAVDVIQPVVCGSIDIKENNFKQCKYTKIEAEYTKDKEGKEKEKITIFRENDNIEPLPINLIGGKRKVEIVLSDYTPDKCRLKEGSHKSGNKAILTGYNIKGKELLDINGGKVTKEFEYQYDILPPPAGNIQALKYIWPIDNSKVQQSTISLTTCRHNKDVEINLYPDIEWELCLVFNADAGSQLLKNKGWSIDQLKAERFESPQKGVDFNLGYQFKLAYKYNDEKSEGTIDIWGKKFKKTIEFLALFEYYFNKLFKLDGGAPEIEKNKGGTPDIDNYKKSKSLVKHSPIRGYLCTPQLVLGIKWGQKNTNTSQVAASAQLFAKFDPLLSIGVVFDIIAIVGRFPGWGTVIAAVRKFLDALNVEINFCIGVYATATVNGEISTDANGNLLKATAEAEIKVLLEADYNGDWILVKVYFRAEGYGKGGIFIEIDYGIDDNGIYYKILPGNTSCELGYKLSGGVKWESEEQDGKTSYSTTETTKESGCSKTSGDSVTILARDYWGDTEHCPKHYINNE